MAIFNRRFLFLCLLSFSSGCASHRATEPASPLAAAEGMWLPNALPIERLKQEFDFTPTEQWAEHLRLSSVDIGASAAFVSADGLILTNHHVAVGGLQNVSREGKDYVTNGFLAKSRDEEIQLPGEQIDVLMSIEDVTARVNQAVDPKLAPADAVKARHSVIADIERESLQKTGYHSNVVTLYGGALYHLYRYKRYTDIRIVFAPEASVAFFGGDPDNFEYPRFDLDIALLRAYENGKPAHVEHFLKLSTEGVHEGDLVFVSGHPGHTDRLLPTSALRVMRDQRLPLRIEGLQRQERALLDYAATSPEAHRQAQEDIFFTQNSLKASRPQLALLKQGIIDQKQSREDALRAALRQDPNLKQYDSAWDRIAIAEQARAKIALRLLMLEEARAFSSWLFWDARQIVRMVEEDAKPDGERLPEYTQSKRDALEQDLFSQYPSYPNLEIAKLSASLNFFRDKLGADDPLVKKVLAGKDPSTRATELINGTKMADAKERKRLYQAGAGAVAASDDPMIRLAREIDDEARSLRLASEAQTQEPETQAMSDINRARFALMGMNEYPDATGTLRLAFGIVKSYQQDGKTIAAWTTFAGAFDHERENGAKDPFLLPATWSKARENLDGSTPLNFVSTADITGGNSGSPVVNRAGELVGVIFDSNRQGVPDNLAYTDKQARAVAVDARAIVEALRKIYGADALLAELGVQGR